MELFLLILIVAMLSYLILASDKVHFKKESARELLIDTSILIDGRFLAVAKTGFIAQKILIPRSVVGELQRQWFVAGYVQGQRDAILAIAKQKRTGSP